MPSENKSSKLIPQAFEKYEECDDCEVTIHGPRRMNSPGGCHVELCNEHQEET